MNTNGLAKQLYEAVRKALIDTLIPEIKELQKGQKKANEQLASIDGRLDKLEMGQKTILDKLDLAQRVAKLEAVVENLRRSA